MSDHLIDLRGDTVAQPTKQMREAMHAAMRTTLGDRAHGDPVVNELERRCAELLGKDAGLLVPSVTMANLVAVMAYCRPGDQVLVDADAHVYRNEYGGISRLCGAMPRAVPRTNAAPNVEAVAEIVSTSDAHAPPIRMLWLENSHERAGGAVIGAEEIAKLRAATSPVGAAIHVDGARFFNAAVALGVSPAALATDVDSVSVGLSKALAGPDCTVLVGNRDLISSATALRKMLGGRLAKGGILAAAGLVALDTMIDRLAEDHAMARELARIVEETPGLCLDMPVITNIIRIDTAELGSARELVAALAQLGILMEARGDRLIRAVTHHHIVPDVLPRIRTAVRTACAVLEGRQSPAPRDVATA